MNRSRQWARDHLGDPDRLKVQCPTNLLSAGVFTSLEHAFSFSTGDHRIIIISRFWHQRVNKLASIFHPWLPCPKLVSSAFLVAGFLAKISQHIEYAPADGGDGVNGDENGDLYIPDRPPISTPVGRSACARNSTITSAAGVNATSTPTVTTSRVLLKAPPSQYASLTFRKSSGLKLPV